ncbi:MAG: M48 family metalloprotease [Candidatus Omnitrophica bacterium]|nr:M48 family metalloprotease [Candidatus Omnitrophota bacterium]
MKGPLKTVLLFIFLAAGALFFGRTVGGSQGITAAGIVFCIVGLAAWRFSDKAVLAFHRAQPLTEQVAPEVHAILRELSVRAGIPMPRLYLLPSAAANAFATGRGSRHAAIAVTHGLIRLLNAEELKGVLAHELAQILDHDFIFSSIVAAWAGVLSWGSAAVLGSGRVPRSGGDGHLLAFLGIILVTPFAAALVRMTISKARTYREDARGGRICGEPLFLAGALKKLEVFSQKMPFREIVPGTSHLFLLSPLPGKGWMALFNTHPPVDERILRLMSPENRI